MIHLKIYFLLPLLLYAFSAFPQGNNSQDQARTAELDQFWNEVSRTIAEGDFEAYAATFHEKATLVSGIGDKAYPIATALSGWKKEFDDTKAGLRKSAVAFRFDRRLGDPTTAYESGIFFYSFEQNGEKNGYYIHFDGLLIKDGTWKMMLEYQKSRASKEEWDALK